MTGGRCCQRTRKCWSRRKIAASQRALAVRSGERRDVAASSGIGIFPGDAGVLSAVPDDIGRDRARIGQIGFGRRDHVRCGDLPVGPSDRAGLLHVASVLENAVSSW